MSLLLFTWDENVELAAKTVLTHLAVHENLRGHPANREPAWGVIQLFNGGVQRVRETKVRDFCNGALLSKQDVPVGGWVEIWTFLPIWWLGYYLAARSPCTILCCSRNSIPRLTCHSKIFTETGQKHLSYLIAIFHKEFAVQLSRLRYDLKLCLKSFRKLWKFLLWGVLCLEAKSPPCSSAAASPDFPAQCWADCLDHGSVLAVWWTSAQYSQVPQIIGAPDRNWYLVSFLYWLIWHLMRVLTSTSQSSSKRRGCISASVGKQTPIRLTMFKCLQHRNFNSKSRKSKTFASLGVS